VWRGDPILAMMTKQGNGRTMTRNGGNFANLVQSGISLAPKVIKAVEAGVEIAAKAGNLLGGRRNRGGYRAGGLGKESEPVAASDLPKGKGVPIGPSAKLFAESQTRANAPTVLSIKYDGPSYKFGKCTYQGMTGLSFASTQILCSVEQNTTVALRGVIKSPHIAGTAGDTSMIGTPIVPCSTYVASTTYGRISNSGTPLYSIAAPFRKFRLKKLMIKFESELATTVAGGMAIAFTADPVDTLLGGMTAVQACSYATSLMTTMWDDAILDCTPSIDTSLKNTNPAQTTLVVLQAVLAAPGSLIMLTDQNTTANLIIGKVIAYQEWEFYDIGPVPTSFAITIAKESSKHEYEMKERQAAYDAVNEKNKKEEEQKEQAYERIFVEEAFPSVQPIPSAPTKKEKGYLSF